MVNGAVFPGNPARKYPSAFGDKNILIKQCHMAGVARCLAGATFHWIPRSLDSGKPLFILEKLALASPVLHAWCALDSAFITSTKESGKCRELNRSTPRSPPWSSPA
jgi:hypothetical protein